MAFLKFIAKSIDDVEIELEGVLSYEISRDIDAPCDALRLTFKSNANVPELTDIKAFNSNELVFNGIIDTQRASKNQNGVEHFIYARSTASVLIDNEAEPRSYCSPTSTSLFHINAEEFGFVNKLPAILSEHNYLVNKGVSRFGAINNFVYGITGKNISVNPQNEIILQESVGEIDFNKLSVISEKRIINRGNLLSQIDYKIDGDIKYSHHIKSRFLEQRGINTSKKINLSSLPSWQKEYSPRVSLSSALMEYYKAEITVDGFVECRLYDKASGNSNLGSLGECFVTSVSNILDSKGERTKFVLSKKYDLEEITYVAE